MLLIIIINAIASTLALISRQQNPFDGGRNLHNLPPQDSLLSNEQRSNLRGNKFQKKKRNIRSTAKFNSPQRRERKREEKERNRISHVEGREKDGEVSPLEGSRRRVINRMKRKS